MISAISSYMKVLKYFVVISIVASAALFTIFVLLPQDIIVDIDQEYVSQGFRINAFLNLTVKEMESRFGEHFAEELQENGKMRGAAWWPSWSPQSHKVLMLRKDQIALLRLYEENDRTVFVWYARDSNNVWKVVKDITPPSGWIE